jgi:hypothetical protein
MKGILLSSVVVSIMASTSALASELPHQNTMGNRAEFSGGFSSNEGESGYFANLRWQFNKYAEVGVGVRSYLNQSRFDVNQFSGDISFVDPDTPLSDFRPQSFRPRHNTYSFDTTFRYPFVLSEGTVVAPYVKAGLSSLNTKDIEFKDTNSTGGNSDSSDGGGTGNSEDSDVAGVLSFESLDSLVFGAGVQMSFSDNHRLTLGAIAYSNDEDFTDIKIDDSQVGALLSYEYRPSRALGYSISFEGKDQLGGSVMNIGVSWVFN